MLNKLKIANMQQIPVKKYSPPLDALIGIADLQAVADLSSDVVQKVRAAMLAPTAKKAPPVFSTSELADLCGIEKTHVLYHAKKGTLPAGVKKGARLEWTLEEAKEWVQSFRKDYLRDPTQAAGVVIAVANFKGGVAKTTTAAALAQGLNLKGHKVLVIDTDPQGSLTTLFGVLPDTEVEEEQTILPLCIGVTESIMPSIQSTYWSGIDLVAAAPFLFNAEFILPARQKGSTEFEFWRVLDHGLEDARNIYDVIIIDTPPSLSYTTINALMAANGVLMPLPPNALDFASSAQFWSLFTDVCSGLFKHGGANKKFNFVDVLLSRVDKSDAVSAAVREWIVAAYGARVLPVEIPKTSIAASASIGFGTVYDMTTSTAQAKTLKRARDAYDQLVQYIEMQITGIWASDIQAMSAIGGVK